MSFMAIALIFTSLGFLMLRWSEQYTYTPGFNGLLLKLIAGMFFVASFVAVCISI